MEGLCHIAKEIPDTDIGGSLAAIESKSQVLHPAIVALTAPRQKKPKDAPPVVLWNHRWEHDKNPDEFFRALIQLKKAGVLFQLIVAGQSFPTTPPIFDEARLELAEQIIHWGHAENRDEYELLLAQSDIVVSTAHHEFFGLAVLEAAMAGAIPLVPDHLSYPELYPDKYRYPPGQLIAALKNLLQGTLNPDEELQGELKRFQWSYQQTEWQRIFSSTAESSQGG